MLKNIDLNSFWLPFSDNLNFKKNPKMLSKANGVYFYSDDNRKILDGVSGLWCTNIGYGRREVIDVIRTQAEKISYCPHFQLGNEDSFSFASKLAATAPKGMDNVFFTNSGSEAVDTALKMALAYWRSRGKNTKVKLIGREKGYHGCGFGGISVGGIGGNRRDFAGLLPNVDHLPHTLNPNNKFVRGLPDFDNSYADKLEDLVTLHDASNIAAVIVEPIAGSAGVVVPPKGYLKRLREICTKHEILLIFDEVITAFGRIGSAFAAEEFDVKPDMITVAKGLTSGYVPMGAVICDKNIYKQMVDNSGFGIEFSHGYTYSAHPLAIAAADACLDVYEKDGLYERSKGLASYFEDAVHSLSDCSDVIDVRNYGLMAGIDLKSSSEGFGKRGSAIFSDAFFNNNILIRVTGDTIALSPPLTIEKKELDFLIDKLKQSINKVG